MKLSKHKIDIARARSGLSDVQIAEKYGATVTATRLLFADKDVRPETAGRLARALDVDVVELLEDAAE